MATARTSSLQTITQLRSGARVLRRNKKTDVSTTHTHLPPQRKTQVGDLASLKVKLLLSMLKKPPGDAKSRGALQSGRTPAGRGGLRGVARRRRGGAAEDAGAPGHTDRVAEAAWRGGGAAGGARPGPARVRCGGSRASPPCAPPRVKDRRGAGGGAGTKFPEAGSRGPLGAPCAPGPEARSPALPPPPQQPPHNPHPRACGSPTSAARVSDKAASYCAAAGFCGLSATRAASSSLRPRPGRAARTLPEPARPLPRWGDARGGWRRACALGFCAVRGGPGAPPGSEVAAASRAPLCPSPPVFYPASHTDDRSLPQSASAYEPGSRRAAGALYWGAFGIGED